MSGHLAALLALRHPVATKATTLAAFLGRQPRLFQQSRRGTADLSTRGTDGEQAIYDKLIDELRPNKLAVTESSGGCGSMYVVEIETERFRGLSRVKQTQLVTSLLKQEIRQMHGIRVLCSVPPAA
ncbi:hypothetical protein GGI11_008835 [Coemansia sp. RSA 2049]|nr:hypothetical protein GGI11_008835 [Coemansia sp. RSA 2049]